MNPEFQRLIWATIRWQRLLFTLVAALMLLYLCQEWGDDKDNDSFLFFAFLFAGVWGCLSVIWVFSEDWRLRTWHWQLMLPLSPWQLVWGKFISALIFPWLAGLIVLLPAFFSIEALSHLVFIFLCNTMAMLLVLTRKSPLLSSVVLILFVIQLENSFETFVEDDQDVIFWYGLGWEAQRFTIGSMLTYIIWQLIGSWRLMARKKQYTPKPLLWLVFLLFHATYLAGFVYNPFNSLFRMVGDMPVVDSFFLAITVVFISCIYLSSFFYYNRMDDLRPFIDAASHRNYQSLWQNVPPWLIAILCSLLSALIFLCISEEMPVLPLMIGLMALRDVSILLILTCRSGGRFPEGMALMLLIVLYILLPLILNTLDINVAWLTPIILVLEDFHPALFLAIVVQSAGAMLLLWHLRLKQFFDDRRSTPL